MNYRYYHIFSLLLFLGLSIASCQSSDDASTTANPDSMPSQPLPPPSSFLALGDSYTIGEAVEVNERWPVQLVTQMGNATLQMPKIIATTGWTTAELQAGIEKEVAAGGVQESYDVVSLLIGVNNQYRGQDTAIYRKEFTELLEQAIGFAKKGEKGVFVVSIPDYGLTPFVANSNKDPQVIAEELDWYNATAQQIAASKGVAFVDITPISRRAGTDPNLIAKDGLHPSGEMYRAWVEEQILDAVKELRKRILQ